MNLKLNTVTSLPPGFLQCQSTDLADTLPGPTLIHLSGCNTRPVFISILLHGNEPVGLQAIQSVLKDYRGKLPRSLSLFVGNIAAAKHGVRRFVDQADYNRVWPSAGVTGDTPEHALMRQVVDDMQQRDPFVSVDLHNNTGLNPHYACVNRLDHRLFHLATLFSRTVVYFQLPKGVQSMAMGELCPAVTLECGKIGDASGVAHAAEFIEACLHMDHLPEQPVRPEDISLFHTVARIEVPAHISFGFGDDKADIVFAEDLEYYNFTELPAGTRIGRYNHEHAAHLDVVDENGNKVEQRFLHYSNGDILLATKIMPTMLTLNADNIRQDCLCYFMERYPLPA